MQKLKIAMVIDVYDTKAGGVVSTKRFVEELRKKGHKVTVISTGWPDKDKVLLKEFYLPVVKKIMKKMKMVFALPNEDKIKFVLKDVDVVHVQFPFYLGVKTITYAKEFNLPVVSTFHVQAENITKNLKINSKKIIKYIYSFFVGKIYNRSDIVVCPSNFAKQELKRFGLKSNNVVISNGFTEEYYPKKLNKQYKNKFTILTVGRLAEEKNQKLIINALKLSKYKKDIQLLIVGDGPLKEELRKMSRELPCKPKILTFVSDKQKIKLYNSCDLYVHCGEVELEGMTVLEAMACSLPVVIYNSDKSASTQFALNKTSLFNNVKDLAKKIDYWYEHPNELQKAKELYLEYSKEFSISASVKKLEETYLKAIALNKNNLKKTPKKIKDDNGKSWFSFLKYLYRFKKSD